MVKVVKEVTAEERRRQELMEARPSLDEIVNLHDFEVRIRIPVPQNSINTNPVFTGRGKGYPPCESMGLLLFGIR